MTEADKTARNAIKDLEKKTLSDVVEVISKNIALVNSVSSDNPTVRAMGVLTIAITAASAGITSGATILRLLSNKKDDITLDSDDIIEAIGYMVALMSIRLGKDESSKDKEILSKTVSDVIKALKPLFSKIKIDKTVSDLDPI